MLRQDLLDLKKYGESWSACARRLGTDARFEGMVLDQNPFPPEGVLYQAWKDAWTNTDNALKPREELTHGHA